MAYLVSTGTWSEVLVGEVKLLHTEGAALIFIIVDELILQYAGHDNGCVFCDVLFGRDGVALDKEGGRY